MPLRRLEMYAAALKQRIAEESVPATPTGR
jgi:hypothetical protein